MNCELETPVAPAARWPQWIGQVARHQHHEPIDRSTRREPHERHLETVREPCRESVRARALRLAHDRVGTGHGIGVAARSGVQ